MDYIAVQINCAISPAGGGWGWKLIMILLANIMYIHCCNLPFGVGSCLRRYYFSRLQPDTQIRNAAFAWLEQLTLIHGDVLHGKYCTRDLILWGNGSFPLEPPESFITKSLIIILSVVINIKTVT
jgi:hypothetical protein